MVSATEHQVSGLGSIWMSLTEMSLLTRTMLPYTCINANRELAIQSKSPHSLYSRCAKLSDSTVQDEGRVHTVCACVGLQSPLSHNLQFMFKQMVGMYTLN